MYFLKIHNKLLQPNWQWVVYFVDFVCNDYTLLNVSMNVIDAMTKK